MDIVLVSLPRQNLDAPPSNISILKAAVEHAGLTAKCIDVNAIIKHSTSHQAWSELDHYYQTDFHHLNEAAVTKRVDFNSLLTDRTLTDATHQMYDDILNRIVDDVMKLAPRWVGVSVFTLNSIQSSYDFITRLKRKWPECRVVVGGMGLSSYGEGTKRADYGEWLVQQNLANTFIFGEGEHALVQLLTTSDTLTSIRVAGQHGTYVPQQQYADNTIWADYSDFDLNAYTGKGNMLYITGSKGCVRNCTFCNVNANWEKFTWRNGTEIANELVYHWERTQTKNFYFTDSLINGNMREFNLLLHTIIAYKEAGKLPNDITIGGQYICRPKSELPPNHYELMAKAGIYNLSVGLESGSDAVLMDMEKGVRRSDYDYMMEQFAHHGIRINILLLVGYPTETLDDHNATCNMLRDWVPYNEQGIVWGVALGKTMVVLPNTPISDDPEHWGIWYDQRGNWMSSKNPTLTYKERIRRRLEIGKLCEDLGYVVKSQQVNMNSMHDNLKRGGYESIS